MVIPIEVFDLIRFIPVFCHLSYFSVGMYPRRDTWSRRVFVAAALLVAHRTLDPLLMAQVFAVIGVLVPHQDRQVGLVVDSEAAAEHLKHLAQLVAHHLETQHLILVRDQACYHCIELRISAIPQME